MIYIDDHSAQTDLNIAWPKLSAQRREYLQHFRRESDRRAGAAAYLLLCRGLREEYGILEKPIFDFGPQGKPELRMENGRWKMDNGQWTMDDGQWTMDNEERRMENGLLSSKGHLMPQEWTARLEETLDTSRMNNEPLDNEMTCPSLGPNIHFNLSHCDEAAACVIDNQPVGIDVETISAYDPQLLPLTMNLSEQQAITKSDYPERVFACLWTMKEAMLKCLGTGLSDDLPNLLIDLQKEDYTSLCEACDKSLIIKRNFTVIPFKNEDITAFQFHHPRFHFLTAISADLRFVFTACRSKG